MHRIAESKGGKCLSKHIKILERKSIIHANLNMYINA